MNVVAKQIYLDLDLSSKFGYGIWRSLSGGFLYPNLRPLFLELQVMTTRHIRFL